MPIHTTNVIVSGLVCLFLHVSCVTCWSSSGELNIRRAVFNRNAYHRFIRPVVNMTAKVGLSLMSINDLNMVDQSMSVTGWLTVEWTDYRLEWTKANYDDVDHIYASDSEVWKPELFIDNSLDDVSILQDDNMLFRVSDSGRVDWELPRIFVTSCTIDTTYYPFDTQECALGVTSWAHTVDELELLHLREDVNVEDIVENGEWRYVTSRVEKIAVITEMTSNSLERYSLLKFVVVLTRRPDYYVTNVILPVLTTSLLITLVFILPVDSGEKVSYALTVLLAQAVLLTLVADSIPSTSIYVSILSVYLAYTLIMGVLAVGLTVLILRLHSEDPDKPVPVWLHKVTRRLFARGACWKGYCCCRNKKEPPNILLPKSNGGLTRQYGSEQKGAFLMYSWTEIADIFDWFLFVFFFWSTIIIILVFMVMLKVGSAL